MINEIIDDSSSPLNCLESTSIARGTEVGSKDGRQLPHLVQPEVVADEGKTILLGGEVQDGFLVSLLDVEVVTSSEECTLDPVVLVHSVHRYCAVFPIDDDSLIQAKFISAPFVEPWSAAIVSALDDLDGVLVDVAHAGDGHGT